VFRDYPYLYDGDLAYERDYLATFAEAPDAIVVIVRDGQNVVGASTGAPMQQVEHDWSAPFTARSEAIDDLFYCAESVLLPEYRGLGLGHAFFDAREAHARALGASRACFCSVIRPDDHPARPDTYRPNDPFWRKRGYAPLDDITAHFAWKDIHDVIETKKTLQFWGRSLSD
jgi:GNAT superfamily N-acetyltransferase